MKLQVWADQDCWQCRQTMISSLDHLQMLQKKFDLGLNYFFSEKNAFQGYFPVKYWREKKKAGY